MTSGDWLLLIITGSKIAGTLFVIGLLGRILFLLETINGKIDKWHS